MRAAIRLTVLALVAGLTLGSQPGSALAAEPVTLSGIVTRASDGTPLVGVKVAAGTATSTTGPDGGYVLGVPPGVDTAAVYGPGWDVHTGPLGLNADRTLNLVIPVSTVTLRVVGGEQRTPLPGVRLLVPMTDGRGSLGAAGIGRLYTRTFDLTTGAAGTSDYPSLAGATRDPKYTPVLTPPAGSGYRSDTYELPQVTADATVDLPLGTPVRLSGRVTTAGGAPLPGIWAQLTDPWPYLSDEMGTGSDGGYSLAVTPDSRPGQAYFEGDDEGRGLPARWWAERWQAMTRDERLDLALPYASTVTARVLDASGAPVAGASVRFPSRTQTLANGTTLTSAEANLVTDPGGRASSRAFQGAGAAQWASEITVIAGGRSHAFSAVVVDGATEAVYQLREGPQGRIRLPGDLYLNAPGPTGMVVNYAVTDTGWATVTCDRPSGSMFPLGRTVVTCRALTGNGGELARDSFAVQVRDGLPSLTLPSDVEAPATMRTGGQATIGAASATDRTGSPLPTTCSRPAGTGVYPPGETRVTCTATDSDGRTVSGWFSVWVVFSWSGVEQPVNPDSSSLFTLGTTVPVRFRLTGASAGVGNAFAKLLLTRVGSVPYGTDHEQVYTDTPDPGKTFRFNAVTGVYEFNLNRETQMSRAGEYEIRVDLGDGRADQLVYVFSLA
ncbi:hypothetical protein [Longispora urticae]